MFLVSSLSCKSTGPSHNDVWNFDTLGNLHNAQLRNVWPTAEKIKCRSLDCAHMHIIMLINIHEDTQIDRLLWIRFSRLYCRTHFLYRAYYFYFANAFWTHTYEIKGTENLAYLLKNVLLSPKNLYLKSMTEKVENFSKRLR